MGLKASRTTCTIVAAMAVGVVMGCGSSPPQPNLVEPLKNTQSASPGDFEAAKLAFWKGGEGGKPLLHLKSEDLSFDLVRVGWMTRGGKNVLVGAGTVKNESETKQLRAPSLVGSTEDEFGNKYTVSGTVSKPEEKLNPGESDWMFFEIGRMVPKAAKLKVDWSLRIDSRSSSSAFAPLGRVVRKDGTPVPADTIEIPPFDEKTALIAPE